MTFTTFTFLLFFALVFAAYWLLRPWRRAQNALLLAASYAFYSWWDWRFSGLMLASSLVDFVAGATIQRSPRPLTRRSALIASMLANLGMLGYFKYCGFFVENLSKVASSLGLPMGLTTMHVVLPVGISFYTFQTMSYTIDIYRRQLRASTSLLDYMTYVSFFPQLVAGPIERAAHLLPQFSRPRSFQYSAAVDGARQALWGVFKKMALADPLGALFVDPVFARSADYPGPVLLMSTVAFALQIYYDFSAYSDIAAGTARCLGFDLMRNFNYPYFSTSVSEFWRRWHISLSTWFRDYVYIPLGGSRAGLGRRVTNVLVTFVVSGFWHGASWNYVVWGAINGLAVMPSVVRRSASGPAGLSRGNAVGRAGATTAPLAMARTFAVILFGWVFFRSRDLAQAFGILRRICADSFAPASYVRLWDVLSPSMFHLGVWGLVGVALTAEWFSRHERHPLSLRGVSRPVRWLAYSAIVWIALYCTPLAEHRFIYFQF